MFLKETYKVLNFILVHLIVVSMSLMNFQYACASTEGIMPDKGAGSALNVDKAANGVSVVNINNPNASGVSHNKFTEYNVDQRGAILNNSRDAAVSQLGGVVLGNENLQNPAKAIINEVMGHHRSRIEGPQEILGANADYILANPNGISINGAEFINTHKATFTTVVPSFDDKGNLEKLFINNGTI